MKKLFSIFSSALVIAIALQSCNQPKVDTAKEMAAIDSAANVRVMAYKDSLNLVCMNNIMVLAQAKADSMMTAAMKKTPAGSKPKPKPVVSKPTVTNRPGESGQGTITNRPGTTTPADPAKKPTISSRPGATSSPATVTPPKL